MEYYIYKYVEDNEIVYIGQSINLQNRIQNHKNDQLKDFHGEIFYFTVKNKIAMDSYEYFLINKYKPKYNTALIDNDLLINMTEPSWTLYEKKEISKETLKLKQEKHYKPVLNKNINTENLKSKENFSFYKNIYYKYELLFLECKVLNAFMLKYLYQKELNLTFKEYMNVTEVSREMIKNFNSCLKNLNNKNLLNKINNEYYLNINNLDIQEAINRYDENLLTQGFNATSKYYFYFLDGFLYNKIIIPREIMAELYERASDFKKCVLKYLLSHGILFNKEGVVKDIKEGRKIKAIEITYVEAA